MLGELDATVDNGRLTTTSYGGLGDGPDDSSLQWWYLGSYNWVSTDCVNVTYVGDTVRDRQLASSEFSNPGSTDKNKWYYTQFLI